MTDEHSYVPALEAEVQLNHTFDAAHRLPHLAGGNSKCANLHGHTWGITLGITGPLQDDGTVVEFGGIKKVWRHSIDTLFDHGALLGVSDPLLPALQDEGSKVHVFGLDAYTDGLLWPTVENVTVACARMALGLTLPDGCRVTSVRVTETPTNSVQWKLP